MICSSLLEDRVPPLRVWGTLFQVHGRWHFSGTLQRPAQLSLISGAQGPFPCLGRNADSQTQLQFCKQPSPPEGPKLKAPCDTKHVLYWHQILVFQLFLFVSHLAVILSPAERSAWKGSRPSAPRPSAAGAALWCTGLGLKGRGHYCGLTMAGVHASSWLTDLISMHWGHFQQEI